MYIDSHCHLNHRRFTIAPDAIVAQARVAGVEGMLTICCRIRQELDALKIIAEANDNVWCTVGTHPHDAGDGDEENGHAG